MIGRLRKIPVSEMYEAGGSTFASWLRENIDILNEAVDLPLSGVQDGRSAAPADLVARDPSGGTVVIENELGESGDGGLGRLVTSLASLGARTGIWIVADSRPEHVAAVSWLNASSRASFYLLKLEAYRIDNSLPAPVISLISGPEQRGNSLPAGGVPSESPGASAAGEPSEPAGSPAAPTASAYRAGGPAAASANDEPPGAVRVFSREYEDEKVAAGGRDTTGLLLYQFWTELLEKARERTPIHADVEPRRETVVETDAGIAGVNYSYVIREHDASVELHIDRGEGRGGENDQIFDALRVTEDAISFNFGGSLEWKRDEGSGARRIEHRIEGLGGYRDEERWPEIQDAMIDAMIRLERALRPHVQRLQI